MRTEKVLPETLLQLMLNVLETAPDFIYMARMPMLQSFLHWQESQ